ncbi:MAG: TonB C-terminal domain-containing protein [Acidobacteriota bacterium]|jgi:TonB family protein|nr:TonB C-terminal domain-containing protein [Acidobacteriota bacterium]
MLEYADSLNQKRGISRLTVVCWMTSGLIHCVVVLVLVLFPELLAGGYYDQFRGFRWGTPDETSPEPWRTVAILPPPERMNMPSPETLRKLMGLGDEDEGAGSPPIQVRFGPLEALEVENPPLPPPPKIENPEVVLPASRAQNTNPEVETNAGDARESSTSIQADLGTGNERIAAKPEATPKIEVVTEAVPRKIPDSIRPPTPPPANPPAKSSAAKESGRTFGSSLFDTQGFPLGDYEEIVVQRVRSKWLIPSNLKQFQRGTTIIFYIDRNGRCADLRVATSSGSKSLDLAALSAVTESDPFPPLPEGFPGERIGVRLVLIPEP